MSDRLNSLLELYKKEPDDSFVMYGIALEYISMRKYEDAERYLNRLLDKDPDYVPGYMQLAQVKEKLDKIDEAREVYKKGIIAAKKQNDLRTVREMEEFLDELE